MNCVHAQAVSRALLEVTRTEGWIDVEVVVVELILRTMCRKKEIWDGQRWRQSNGSKREGGESERKSRRKGDREKTRKGKREREKEKEREEERQTEKMFMGEGAKTFGQEHL